MHAHLQHYTTFPFNHPPTASEIAAARGAHQHDGQTYLYEDPLVYDNGSSATSIHTVTGGGRRARQPSDAGNSCDAYPAGFTSPTTATATFTGGRPQRTETESSSISTWSTADSTTSSQLIHENNDAFAQLRTANGVGPAGQPYSSTPIEWIEYDAPSVKRGDWKSYGTVHVRVYTLFLDKSSRADCSKREIKSTLKTSRSSTCAGTVWVTAVRPSLSLPSTYQRQKIDQRLPLPTTQDRLLFVFAEGSLPVHNDAAETKRHSIVSSWIDKFRTSGSSSGDHHHHQPDGHLPHTSSRRPGPADEEVPYMDNETGYPVTGFEVPLSTLVKVGSKRVEVASKDKEKGRRGSSGSMSRTFSRTTTHSATHTPALSRVQSRASQAHGGRHSPGAATGGTSFFGGGGGAGSDERRTPSNGSGGSGTSTGKKHQDCVIVEARQDLGDAGRRFTRLEFTFNSSGFFQDEAKELVKQLNASMR